MFLRWFLCRLPKSLGGGHLRGKPTGQILPGLMKQYACPRCGAQWARKISDKETKQ